MIAGDTHGDIEWMSHLTKTAAHTGAATILQVGDFGYWPRMTTLSGDSFARLLLDRLAGDSEAYGVDWIFIDGNHDDHYMLSEDLSDGTNDDGFVELAPNVRYSPRGHRFTIGETRFGTLGGAVSLDAWAEYEGYCSLGPRGYRRGWNWFPDLEAPRLDDVARLVEGGDLDVLLTHEAPSNVDMTPYNGLKDIYLDPDMMRRSGDVRGLVAHAAAATKARVLVHGHWHRRVSSFVEYPESNCIVEGLASNGRNGGRDGRAYLFLDLGPSTPVAGVRVIDGRDTAALTP